MKPRSSRSGIKESHDHSLLKRIPKMSVHGQDIDMWGYPAVPCARGSEDGRAGGPRQCRAHGRTAGSGAESERALFFDTAQTFLHPGSHAVLGAFRYDQRRNAHDERKVRRDLHHVPPSFRASHGLIISKIFPSPGCRISGPRRQLQHPNLPVWSSSREWLEYLIVRAADTVIGDPYHQKPSGESPDQRYKFIVIRNGLIRLV
jgi:hypothetical protein